MTPDVQAAADRVRAYLDAWKRGAPNSDLGRVAALIGTRYQLMEDDLRLLLAALDPAAAEEKIHHNLHDLNVRIVGLNVGDCHCNLITQVILDALAPGRQQ